MNILPTVVQETVSQCKKQGFVISAALASFFIKTQLLTIKKDPQNNAELTPEHVERLVNSAVTSLTLNDSPMLETFKLQASLTTAQQEQISQLRTEKVRHKAKSHMIMEDIWHKRDPNEVFADITLYILHESKQVDSGDAAQKEVMLALESVFPRVHMDSFIAQRESEKVRQLEEIWRIVWGIRVFNKASGKSGGSGIPDLLKDSRMSLEKTVGTSMNVLNEVEVEAKRYAAVLNCPSLTLGDASRLRLQDEYLNTLQLIVYLRSLLETLDTLRHRAADFEPTYMGVISEIQTLVSGADAASVPKNAIYPRFVSLSENWDILYTIHREAQDSKALLDLICAYHHSFTPSLHERDVEHALSGLAPERVPNRELIATEVTNPAVQYLVQLPEDRNDSRLEFNGFCIVSYVEDGVLLDGKREDDSCPGFLLLHANSAYYAFSSERALKMFARDPFKYLSQRLMDTVQSTPVLIFLLGLHPYLPKELYLSGSRVHEVAKMVEKGDGATQTGQVDTFKDTHYEWNEWELRRLALQLAGLRNKKTKSAQTDLSHFRRDNDCQVFPPKEQSSQTLVDNASVQPPRVRQYIKGLRGTQSSEIEVVQKVFQY